MSSDYSQLWDGVLTNMEVELPRASFSTWFKNTWVLEKERGVVHIGVPNDFVKDWLENKYHKSILKYLRDQDERVRGVEYVVARRHAEKEEDEKTAASGQEPGALPLHDLYIDKKNNLNPRYTFDSFVVGSFNELAHAAAQAVVKSPGVVYNPLFVHGGTGLGKTHIIQAIGNTLKKQKEKKIIYITSEKFGTEFVNALQNQKMNSFKDQYRSHDVFIMDDIQFFSNKEKTQEELFHLFNELYENNKQIIFSSDRHPNFIPGLEERLKSRFGAGMVVDISRPDYESRYSILRHKANIYNISLSEPVLDYISTYFEGSVRDLEGVLNTLLCQTQLKNSEVGVNEVKKVLKNNTRPKKNVSPKEIIKTVAGFYNIEEKDIYKKTRKKEVVRPRQIIMFLLREDFGVSYPVIGEKLGGRDHTTVIHSCERIRNDLKEDNMLEQEIDQIRSVV